MKYLHRLVKNGSSTQVTIPVRMLHFLQWRTGQTMVIELTSERTLIVRPPTAEDIGVSAAHGASVGLLPETHA